MEVHNSPPVHDWWLRDLEFTRTVWDGSTCRVYGKHQFTSPIERSINVEFDDWCDQHTSTIVLLTCTQVICDDNAEKGRKSRVLGGFREDTLFWRGPRPPFIVYSRPKVAQFQKTSSFRSVQPFWGSSLGNSTKFKNFGRLCPPKYWNHCRCQTSLSDKEIYKSIEQPRLRRWEKTGQRLQQMRSE